MAVVVNSGQPTESSSSNNFLLGVIFLLILAVLFIVYVLPRIGSGFGNKTQLNIPNQYDVNVHTNK